MSSIAIGPGLGTATGTSDLVHKLLKTQTLPMVLDADGLNVCAGHTSLFTEYTGELVITPHPGEFSRLTGASTKEIADNRIEMVRSFSEKWNIVVVLKGAPTIVGVPGGRVYINSTGNAGMATAGSGDVLTGLVAGLLAQGLTAGQAAVAGVYTHGLAGDLAKQEYGKAGMTAGHLLEKIPASLQKIMKENA